MIQALALIACVLSLTACGGKSKAEAEPPSRTPEAGLAEPAPQASRPEKTPEPKPKVDKLNLRALPTVINVDDDPLPEGVQVELFLFRLDTPLAVALEEGVVEFLIYEGRVPPPELDLVEPLSSWPYRADELARFGARTAFGSGYGMVLRWDDRPPRSSSVTIAARLLRPGGRALYAQPLYLAVGAK